MKTVYDLSRDELDELKVALAIEVARTEYRVGRITESHEMPG